MKQADDKDMWSHIHGMLHPASGASAMLVDLVVVNGYWKLIGASCRVGKVGRISDAVNSSPYLAVTS